MSRPWRLAGALTLVLPAFDAPAHTLIMRNGERTVTHEIVYAQLPSPGVVIVVMDRIFADTERSR